MNKDTADEMMDKGNSIYENIRTILEEKYSGKIVAIDCDTHDYFVGDTEIEACEKGRSKYHDKIFVCKRIGSKYTYFVGYF